MIGPSTGLNETTAIALGYPVETAIVHRSNHAGYYSNYTNLTLKLVHNKEPLDILGGQGIGYNGCEKGIDVLATAIIGKLKVTDLPKLELYYVPPFSSAKDPVNILGYAASHEIEGLYKTFKVQDHDTRDVNIFILDVRTDLEYLKAY
jgi:hypothetical protein